MFKPTTIGECKARQREHNCEGCVFHYGLICSLDIKLKEE